MAIVNPDIFRSYDVRGLYGQDFDASFAEEFGNKVALALKAKALVVGRDSRATSAEIEKALIQGILHAGVKVYEIGECTTPTFYHSVHAQKTEGGIMVTASHNPEAYNGFKVVGEGATIIGGEALRALYTDTDLDRSGGGTIEPFDGAGAYADAVLYMGGSHDPAFPTFAVGVKGSKAHQKILEKIGEKAGILFSPKNPFGLQVEFDNDADRIIFYDQKKRIDADLIAMLIAEKKGFKKIIHDFRFSKGVREQFEKLGITGIPSKVGRLNVYENMRSYQADFGAELSGHFYLKDFNFLESPETVLLWIRNIIQKEGKNLSELVRPYDTYYRTGELDFPWDAQAFARVRESYADGKLSEEDGILIEYDDWWFSLRKSNTEPVMRLIVEAKNEELLNRKVSELEALLR